jgi:hypothetical protein
MVCKRVQAVFRTPDSEVRSFVMQVPPGLATLGIQTEGRQQPGSTPGVHCKVRLELFNK